MSTLVLDGRLLVAPFAPLVHGGTGLDREPEARPTALTQRMARLYGVASEYVLPVRGADHGRFLVERVFGSAAKIIDERNIEFSDERSLAIRAYTTVTDFILRDMTFAYGLAGAPCGAVIANRGAIQRLTAELPRWDRVPTPVVRLALAALDPSRALANQARIATVRAEVARVVAAVPYAIAEGAYAILTDKDHTALDRLGVDYWWLDDQARAMAVPVGTPEVADLVLAAMGIPVPPRAPARRADVARDTKETRIVATVDLDRAEPVDIATGIGFYDHMLEQVARHGGFSLTLAAEGDLHIEAHHTIEDSALALGEALRQALGDRKGVARFGFVAPLDEAEAAVTLDLSGRPFVKFEGEFRRAMIGEYPTEMTAHVFRSLADAMRATIHVRVTGEDDHHKTEAAFKSFGRALRQAIRVEGDAIPSTKGVLA